MFNINSKIIWVNGMPRSGTSWLAQIIDSSPKVKFKMAPLFSYEFKGVVNEEASKNEWYNFFIDVFNSDNDFLNQVNRVKKGDFVSFIKDPNQNVLCIKDVRYHQLIEKIISLGEHVKVIHIIRNPCATIASWMSSEKEYKITEGTEYDEWKTGKTRKTNESEFWGFNDWINLTCKYLDLERKYPKQVYVIRYEELVNKPNEEVKKLFRFCDLNYSQQTTSFLEKSHSKHEESDYSVFKSPEIILNKWKSTLPKSIKNEIIQTTLQKGLSKYIQE